MYNKYSQLGQDDWVLKNEKMGFFVEIGAHDGLTLSNTLKMEELGWSGLCVEPNPYLYKQLMINRKCKCSDLAVHNTTGKIVKFQCSDLYGGIPSYLNHAEVAANPGPIVEVETITLDGVLKQFECPKDITYISVDTEGNELDILKVFPFDEWNIKYWSVEHNDHTRNNTNRSTDLTKLFVTNGYKSQIMQFDIWFWK